MDPAFTHLTPGGSARMVEISQKTSTPRRAWASAVLQMEPATLRAIQAQLTQKGDVLAVARVAGIMAAKRTSELIPLCHALQLTHAEIDFSSAGEEALRIDARVSTIGPTGVEMEALTAASVAALTIYDMCKAMDRGMMIRCVQLEEKAGGDSGTYRR